jgi:predicted nuclease of predicted toxin-antitoxin system
MKFKIDENLPIEVAEILNQKGYEAKTVIDQNLSGEDDPEIASVFQTEERVLITLDIDFGDIRTYPPEKLEMVNCNTCMMVNRNTSVMVSRNTSVVVSGNA